MGLSSDLISQFVKATKEEDTSSKETTVYGTTVEYNGYTYVKLDGSDLLTPVSTTADTKPGERVTVMIKDHTATVTGNISSPSARTDDVKEIGSQITEFEIVMAYRVSTEELEAIDAYIENLRGKVADFENVSTDDLDAVNAEIENLKSKFANITHISANDITAITATLENLKATFGKFTGVSTEDLEAVDAYIENIEGYVADFTYVSADVLSAFKANIEKLQTEKLSATEAELKYANIDFGNIGEAAIRKLFSDSGLIRDLVVGDGTITGELVGVTIKGDLIEGNTIKADKLVVKGSDGLYYKLNFEGGEFVDGEEVPTDSLHGSVITAKSITATKISVDDLVAFDATIGGFNITKDSIYSGVKSSADNATRGIYLDNEGQMAIGDASNFIRYYKDQNGNYKLDISMVNDLEIGGRNLIRNSTNLIFEDYAFAEGIIPLSVIDDGSGNITIVGGMTTSDDGSGNIVAYGVIATDDGDGSVTLSV